ncbi:hypothetical protein BN2537_15561 [Streptomyces venezuelae]|nr:hypothetical protein BN2537_15561 [Streptomyces venezuelae]
MSRRSTTCPPFRTHVFRTLREPRGQANVRSCGVHRPLRSVARGRRGCWPKRRHGRRGITMIGRTGHSAFAPSRASHQKCDKSVNIRSPRLPVLGDV